MNVLTLAYVILGLSLLLPLPLWLWGRSQKARLREEAPRRGLTPSERVDRAETAQAFFGVEGAQDGILSIDGRRFRLAIRVDPVNVALLSQEEADALQQGFRAFLDAQRDPYTIYVPAARIDPAELVAPLLREAGRLSPELSAYAKSLAESVAAWVEEKSPITRRHVVLLHYDHTPDMAAQDEDAWEVARARLSTRAAAAIRDLARAGFSAKVLSTEEALQLLHDFVMREEGRGFSLADAARSNVFALVHTEGVRGREGHA
jgi:hypothetical protein